MSKLQIKVVPRASRDEIVGWLGERLKVRVTAAPEGGKANSAVIKLLAKALGVPKSQIAIVSGTSSSKKTLEIDGVVQQQLSSKLATVAPKPSSE